MHTNVMRCQRWQICHSAPLWHRVSRNKVVVKIKLGLKEFLNFCDSFFFWFKFSNTCIQIIFISVKFLITRLIKYEIVYMECFSKWSIELSQGYIYMALKIHEFALNTNNLFNLNFQAHEFSRYWNKGNVYITEKKKSYATPFFLSQSPSPPL